MLAMRGLWIATVLGLTLGSFATSALGGQCPDVLQQDKSQQNSADEAHVRGDLKAGSDCANPADETTSEKKDEDAAVRAKSKTDEQSGTVGQSEPKGGPAPPQE
jgi:hypothetical protein